MALPHLLRASRRLVEFGPEAFDLFSIRPSNTVCVVQGKSILTLVFVPEEMQLANANCDPVDNFSQSWEAPIKPLLKILVVLAADIVRQDDSPNFLLLL